jgi:hypothetical protein
MQDGTKVVFERSPIIPSFLWLYELNLHLDKICTKAFLFGQTIHILCRDLALFH